MGRAVTVTFVWNPQIMVEIEGHKDSSMEWGKMELPQSFYGRLQVDSEWLPNRDRLIHVVGQECRKLVAELGDHIKTDEQFFDKMISAALAQLASIKQV